ncbi:MAG: hypothetical protein LC750_00465 [Actinobacteria bacterium]|nr:hypothetical protein [Actinomycetota bacterium]
MPDPTWKEFDPRAPQPPSPETIRYSELCLAVFSTAAGKELLQEMRRRTIEVRTPPFAPDYRLREEEAVRRFVSDIERAMQRARETAKPAPTS